VGAGLTIVAVCNLKGQRPGLCNAMYRVGQKMTLCPKCTQWFRRDATANSGINDQLINITALLCGLNVWELCQTSTKFDNFWHTDSQQNRIM